MVAEIGKDGLLGLHDVLANFLLSVVSNLASLSFRFQYSFHEFINLGLNDILTQVFEVFCTKLRLLKLLSIPYDIFT